MNTISVQSKMFSPRMVHVMYTSSHSGTRGQSLRVIANGGLSALRNDRKVKGKTLDARSLSSGALTRPMEKLFPERKIVAPSGQSLVTNFLNKHGGRRMSTNKMISVNENGIVRHEVSSDNNSTGGAAPLYRTQFSDAKRVVIKLGSAVITRQDGGNGLALGRLAAIVEQVAELQNNGRECVLITSGAVEYGKQKLSNELLMSMSLKESMQANSTREQINSVMKDKSFTKPNAAVGQSGLQALYETMFRNYGIVVGQVLVNKQDFTHEYTRQHLLATMNELLALGIIPIINTNDAVISAPGVVESAGAKDSLPISDNDSLAANIAVSIGAHLAILMSDVDGIYDKPPSKKGEPGGGRIIHTFNPEDKDHVEFGDKSSVGTGGMESKAKAALWALERGSPSVICNGMAHNTIRKIMDGQKIGTFFTTADKDVTPVEVLAKNARQVSRRLQSLSPGERANIIHGIAEQLIARAPEIIEQNGLDLALARAQGLTGPMYDRLILTEGKLKSLSEGLMQIADRSLQNLGRVVRRTRVSDSISLVQKTVPIGVLMVIFESRPDCLPQVASLAIASANGLLMKGGKEASNTNDFLMDIVKRELTRYSCQEAISLVSSREAIGDLLKMDQMIDLVIPRGSSELVRSIKEQSKMIPVLGHAEGVCHVFVDVDADANKALEIIKDSKCDYPAACNAMETLLLHEGLLNKPAGGGVSMFEKICSMLKANGVEIYSGPNLQEHLTFGPSPAENLRHEYGAKACTVEIVKDVYAAMEHIHAFGSSHTDVIVSENANTVESFLEGTDSACTFANISSRIADGYRMGLGAEVGISTGRIHARGPVGVEGLMTTKWVVRGNGDTAQDYATGKRTFTHQQLAVQEIGDKEVSLEEED